MTIPEFSTPKRVWYGPYEGFELRIQRRLKDDLSVDEAAVDVILHLRSQIVELQARIKQLESELTAQAAGQKMRLARYKEVNFEVVWVEIEIPE